MKRFLQMRALSLENRSVQAILDADSATAGAIIEPPCFPGV